MARKTNRREFVQVAGLAASGLMAAAGSAAAAEARCELSGKRHRDDCTQRKSEQRNTERSVAERQAFLSRFLTGSCR